MEPLTIRIQADTKESLENEAAEYDVCDPNTSAA